MNTDLVKLAEYADLEGSEIGEYATQLVAVAQMPYSYRASLEFITATENAYYGTLKTTAQ